jgi:hypothetical protein
MLEIEEVDEVDQDERALAAVVHVRPPERGCNEK